MNLFNLRRSPPSLDDLAVEGFQSAASHSPSREYLMTSVERTAQVFIRGQGSWLWDSDDRAYLDFTQGGGANSLGHSPTVLVKALAGQAQAFLLTLRLSFDRRARTPAPCHCASGDAGR